MRFLTLLFLTTCLCFPAIHYGQDAIAPKHTFLFSVDNYLLTQTKNDYSQRKYGTPQAGLSIGLGISQKFYLSEKTWISGALNLHLVQHHINGQFIKQGIAFQNNELRDIDTHLRLLDVRLPLSYGLSIGSIRAFAIEVGIFASQRIANFSKQHTTIQNQFFIPPNISTGSPGMVFPSTFIGEATERSPNIPGEALQLGAHIKLGYQLTLQDRAPIIFALDLSRFLSRYEVSEGQEILWSSSFSVEFPF